MITILFHTTVERERRRRTKETRVVFLQECIPNACSPTISIMCPFILKDRNEAKTEINWHNVSSKPWQYQIWQGRKSETFMVGSPLTVPTVGRHVEVDTCIWRMTTKRTRYVAVLTRVEEKQTNPMYQYNYISINVLLNLVWLI